MEDEIRNDLAEMKRNSVHTSIKDEQLAFKRRGQNL